MAGSDQGLGSARAYVGGYGSVIGDSGRVTDGAGGDARALLHCPATSLPTEPSISSRRREENLGVSPTVVDLEPAPIPTAGKARVGRCACPSLSQSSGHNFQPIEAMIRDQPTTIQTTAFTQNHLRLIYQFTQY